MNALAERTVRSAAQPASLHLPYTPESVGAARRLVRGTLEEWQLADLVDAAELIVSELAGNAAKTGCRKHMTVAIRRLSSRHVRISVQDGCRSMPFLLDADPAAESGRGLALVHQLTAGHWGVTLEGLGKTVHADLPVGPDSYQNLRPLRR